MYNAQESGYYCELSSILYVYSETSRSTKLHTTDNDNSGALSFKTTYIGE